VTVGRAEAALLRRICVRRAESFGDDGGDLVL
jgi:hypothetical protein